MKKQKSAPESLVKPSKIEQPVTATGPKITAKKTAKQSVTETRSATPKPAPKKSVRAAAKSRAEKPVAVSPELHMLERIGMTAGNIWNYLHEKGATPIAKLVRELAEDEKIIQRSIGWLAKEDKITLSIKGRAEHLALKD